MRHVWLVHPSTRVPNTYVRGIAPQASRLLHLSDIPESQRAAPTAKVYIHGVLELSILNTFALSDPASPPPLIFLFPSTPRPEPPLTNHATPILPRAPPPVAPLRRPRMAPPQALQPVRPNRQVPRGMAHVLRDPAAQPPPGRGAVRQQAAAQARLPDARAQRSHAACAGVRKARGPA